MYVSPNEKFYSNYLVFVKIPGRAATLYILWTSRPWAHVIITFALKDKEQLFECLTVHSNILLCTNNTEASCVENFIWIHLQCPVIL